MGVAAEKKDARYSNDEKLFELLVFKRFLHVASWDNDRDNPQKHDEHSHVEYLPLIIQEVSCEFIRAGKARPVFEDVVLNIDTFT